MPVKIRFEQTRYPHWGERSGYVQFVQQLDRAHYDVTLHAASDSDEDLARWLKPFAPWLQRFIERGRMPWYKLSDFNAELLALKESILGGIDIIHFLDGEHSGQFLPRLIKKVGLSIRTVATFHQPPYQLAEVVNPELLSWFDKILLVAPSQLPFFQRYVPKEKLQVLLHGVDTDFFHPAPQSNSSHRMCCVTVGHFLRDWSAFCSVAQRLSDVTFNVVTKEQIRFDGVSNVIVQNGISDAALAELYRSCDVLFLPLTESTANNTLLEGIASGLPVVTTDLEAVRTYLPRGEGIFVEANRVDTFARVLRRLQQDVELRRTMGQQARKRAEELAWSRLVGDYEAVYKELLQSDNTMRKDGCSRQECGT